MAESAFKVCATSYNFSDVDIYIPVVGLPFYAQIHTLFLMQMSVLLLFCCSLNSVCYFMMVLASIKHHHAIAIGWSTR